MAGAPCGATAVTGDSLNASGSRGPPVGYGSGSPVVCTAEM